MPLSGRSQAATPPETAPGSAAATNLARIATERNALIQRLKGRSAEISKTRAEAPRHDPELARQQAKLAELEREALRLRQECEKRLADYAPLRTLLEEQEADTLQMRALDRQMREQLGPRLRPGAGVTNLFDGHRRRLDAAPGGQERSQP